MVATPAAVLVTTAQVPPVSHLGDLAGDIWACDNTAFVEDQRDAAMDVSEWTERPRQPRVHGSTRTTRRRVSTGRSLSPVSRKQ